MPRYGFRGGEYGAYERGVDVDVGELVFVLGGGIREVANADWIWGWDEVMDSGEETRGMGWCARCGTGALMIGGEDGTNGAAGTTEAEDPVRFSDTNTDDSAIISDGGGLREMGDCCFVGESALPFVGELRMCAWPSAVGEMTAMEGCESCDKYDARMSSPTIVASEVVREWSSPPSPYPRRPFMLLGTSLLTCTSSSSSVVAVPE